MQICRNKHSGRYFIYLFDGVAKDTAVLITPDGEEKLLNLDRFEDVEDIDESHVCNLPIEVLLTYAQIQAWREYETIQSDELAQKIDFWWESLTPYKKKEFLKEMKKR